jgi:acyl carrier protein
VQPEPRKPHLRSVPADQGPAVDESGLIDLVTHIVRDSLHTDVDDPDRDLIEDGVLDSLAVVELLFEIERLLNVRLALDEMEIDDFRSVRRIARFAASRLEQRPPTA